MAVDKRGNVIIKKDFWADGGWYTVFFLMPLAVGWCALILILAYGAYFSFRYDPEHLKVGFLFLIFAFLVGLSGTAFLKSLLTLFVEKVIFTSERIIYQGFGSYSLPYKKISRITLRERPGPFGAEKFLFFVAADDTGKKDFYIIPRWKTLAGGKLGQELGKRMPLNILDRGLLSFYVSFHGREWWLPIGLASAAILAIVSFLLARASPESTANITVLFWLALAAALIFFLSRYAVRKKDVKLT